MKQQVDYKHIGRLTPLDTKGNNWVVGNKHFTLNAADHRGMVKALRTFTVKATLVMCWIREDGRLLGVKVRHG